jgi:hypothetical protein
MNLVALLAVAWPVTGLLGAWLAGERGRDPLPWFVLCLVLGPFALLALGFSERAPGRQFKRCVECQEVVPRLATTCPQCRTDLIKAEQEERARSVSHEPARPHEDQP